MNFPLKAVTAALIVLAVCSVPIHVSCSSRKDSSTETGRTLFPRQESSKPTLTAIKPETLRLKDCDGVRVWRYSVSFTPNRTVGGYVFEPEKTGEAARSRILFGHWLGGVQGVDISEREFFPEAVAWAREGRVCVIPVGDFPWMTRPYGTDRDYQLILDEVENYRMALDVLFSRPGPKPGKALLIAHDYGAMYGILLAAADSRVGAAVLMTPVPDFASWNLLLTRIPDDKARERYARLLEPVDPIRHVSSLGIPLLFQFSENDEWLPEGDAGRLIAEIPSGKSTVTWYPTTHNIHKFPKATSDRRAWVEKAFIDLR